MSHPLKDYARALQRALVEDKTLEIPAYSWCLRMAIEHVEAARAAEEAAAAGASRTHKERKAEVTRLLVEIVRPKARGRQ